MPNTPVRTIVPAIDEAAALAWLTGRQVRGYQLGNLLGHGGFGAVYQSTQPMLGREVAIKIIHPRHANHPQFIRQFESEAQLIARLEHPHIVPLYDYWRDPSGAYLVMRYLRGGSLHDALQGGPWPLPACVRLLEQIGPALATAHHQGIVHRDVKPANILLDPEGNAYLADFGIAQAGGGFVRHTGGDRLPMYAAPEQIRGEAVSPQTDIYCLGLVLYQALAGAPAFVGPTPDAVAEGHLYSPLPAITTPRPELPAELALVLDQATAKDPADRYSDIEGLIADLRRAAGAGLLAPDEILRLPTGMVAFLFTDIENSTQRWEQDPTAMQAALTHHDSLLRQAFASTGGRPFQSTGDSFAVAFATAEAALACAVQAQQLLAGTVWPAPLGTLRVRMAIGVGAAAIRDGGYHAEYTLNRLARLMATGHGGQILLSGDAVAALGAPAAGALPAGAALRELGTWRLRDISDPVAVWQLVVPGLPAEFPPLRTTGATAPEPLAPPSNPYKGLRAFQEADAADLFGREALVARLVARLAAPDPLRRFLAVVGPSGSGKSSAVRAGLVPALRRGAVPDLPAPFVTDLTPGPAPLEQIEQALLRVAVRQPRDLRALLQAGPDGLIRAVAAILPDDGGTELVLVLDQFEEVFTLGDDEAARVGLLDMLRAAALAPGSRLRVILTLRADFYDRPLLYPQLGDLLRERTEVVVPLTRAELQAAISGPAARVGVEVEPALLATLMQEVSEQPGMLPLLQYTLTELFAERTGRRLTLAAYVAAGGVLGSLGLRADAIYAALDPAAQVVARQVFLRLVTLGEGAEDTRRRARQTELAALAPDPGALAAVLDAFGQHWLLTFDRDPRTREPTVEVAHEALIRTWGQMRAWLDAGRADLRVQRQLHTAAHEWQDGGQDASFLARGARLGQFAALADSREVALTAEERTFLTASLAARAADAAAEEARRGQELALARSAARRLRSLVAVLAVFLIVAGALAAFAASRQAEAETQRTVAIGAATRAEAQRLAAEAIAAFARADDPEAAALLSIRSLRTALSPEGITALQNAGSAVYPRLHFPAPTGPIIGALFAPDGRTLLTAQADQRVQLWDTTTGQPGAHYALQVTAQTLLGPDAHTAFVAEGPIVHLRELETGRELQQFAGDPADIANLAVTPDGRTLVTGNRAGSLAVWDVASGQLRRHVAIGPGRIEALAVAPDGGRVALVILGSGGAALSRWDLQTGLALPPLKGLQGQVLAVAYAHQSNQMITGGLDKTAQLWDAQTGAPGPVLAGHTARIDAVAFSPDDRMVVTTSGDKTVRVWETASGHEIQAFPPGTIQAVARIALFTPDGRSVLAGGGSAPLSLWDVAAAPLLPHFPSGFPVALSPDEATLLGGGLAGPEAWDLRTGQPLKTALTGHPAAEWPAQFAADGRQVVLVEHAGPGAPGYVGQVRDTQTGTLVQRVPLPAIRGPAGRAPWAFAPDLGRVIQAAGGQAELRDRASGQVLHTFRDPGGPITDVAWAPDGTRVATLARTQAGGPDSSLRPAPPGPGEGGGNPADVPPGTGSSPPPAPATIRIWDAAGGQELRALSTTVDSSRVLLDLSPDGHWLLTGESPNAVTIWDLAGGTAAQHLVGHRGPIQDAHFSADSKRVVTASMDQTARLWDVAGGQELGRWTHAGGVVQAFLTANGKQLLTWSRDNIARFWYVNPSDAMDALCGRLVRDLTPDEREHYSITATDPTCPAR